MSLQTQTHQSQLPEIHWQNSPGHFIFADECAFCLHAHVGKYCVATIGERHTEMSGDRVVPVGFDLYTTVVFKLNGHGTPVMPELETQDYATREAAIDGHMSMLHKYQETEPAPDQ
jgi:hypothetical protein